MDRLILENIGLTDGEIRVYLSLIELGQSPAGQIVRKSKVSSSKIYDVLDRLIEKGMVTYITKGKRRLFRAAPPSRLIDFVDKQREELSDKEERLRELLPELERLRKAEPTVGAEILEGAQGIKAFFEMSLRETKRGDEVLVMGYPRLASQRFNAYFKDFHKRREAKGVRGRVVYNYDAWFGKKREPRKFVGQRYLPRDIHVPAFLYIFNDVVGTIIFTDEQKMCFMIQNKEVADSYRQYFELMWKQAIKV